MEMGRNKLELDIFSLEGLLYVIGALIIQDVDVGLLAMFLQDIKDSESCFSYCTGVARLAGASWIVLVS